VTAHAAALARIRFTALDAGKAVVPHVLVTAMAFGPDGIIYAGGRYMAPDTNPGALQPVAAAGSVWLVSHDHGAHWSQRISTTSLVVLRRNVVRDTWTDHTSWPIDFTANSITVDRTTPHVIYVAGCTGGDVTCVAGVNGQHLLLRSTNGGRTWQDALIYHQTALGPATPRNVVTNIVKSPALLAVVARGPGVAPDEAFDVAVDPYHHARVYVSVSRLGTLRSDDGARTWRYFAQPTRGTAPCELLIDPHNAHVIYSLDRGGEVYRSTDAGMHWVLRSAFGYASGQNLSSLLVVKGTLYVTAGKGLYASTDGGAHWRLVKPEPLPHGTLYQSIRAAGGWIAVVANNRLAPPEGLYAARDGQNWQPVAYTDMRGPRYAGSLDFLAYADHAIRMWEDHATHIVFTAGPLGGLYRWSSSL
jgi:photosystem II stability/assembly factor-like uncharacterized protein